MSRFSSFRRVKNSPWKLVSSACSLYLSKNFSFIILFVCFFRFGRANLAAVSKWYVFDWFGIIKFSLTSSKMFLHSQSVDDFLDHSDSLLTPTASVSLTTGSPLTKLFIKLPACPSRYTCLGGSRPRMWLESPRKYIPISRMSPNHAHSRASPGLNFSRNCTGPFTSFQ